MTRFDLKGYHEARLFTADDAWSGGNYELALEIGPRSDDSLYAALVAIWDQHQLHGPFLDRGLEPEEQLRLPLSPDLLARGHLHGLARLSSGARTPCGTCIIREEEGPMQQGPDWLCLYLPLGSLGSSFPVGGFPFDNGESKHDAWRFPVEDWLAGVGTAIFSRVPFRLGIIGFEVSGMCYADELAASGIPKNRNEAYLWPVHGRLEYYRRNR